MRILENDTRARARGERSRLALAALTAAALMWIACSTPGANESTPAGDIREGWVDDEAYRFVHTGRSKVGTENAPEADRSRTACDAALMMAQARAIEVLAEAGLKNVSGTVTVTEYRDRIVKEIQGFVRGGRVVSHAFSPVDNTCTIVYEIREKDLKKRVLMAAEKNKPPVSY